MQNATEYTEAQSRLAYEPKAIAAFHAMLDQLAVNSPYKLNADELAHAKGCISDAIGDLFYEHAESDRELVETADRKEAVKEKQEHVADMFGVLFRAFAVRA